MNDRILSMMKKQSFDRTLNKVLLQNDKRQQNNVMIIIEEKQPEQKSLLQNPKFQQQKLMNLISEINGSKCLLLTSIAGEVWKPKIFKLTIGKEKKCAVVVNIEINHFISSLLVINL